MKIGVFDPYLDTLGGGERYMLTLADCLSRDHEVTVFWDDRTVLSLAEKKFDEDYSKVRFKENIFNPAVGKLRQFAMLRKYDRIFFLSDGSIPLLVAKKNFILFQFPIPWVTFSFLDRCKLFFINRVVFNSLFVAKHNDKVLHKPSVVLYPPVKPVPVLKVKKENLILNVGRFTAGMNRKKQEVLIDFFQKHRGKFPKDWRLVFIGSVLHSDEEYFRSLQKRVKTSDITILENPSYTKLAEYYSKAKIYWHAAGYDEDEVSHPERAEHFGIAAVEAMSAGCVPVAYSGGGLPEILSDGKDGFLWHDLDELFRKTTMLMTNFEKWQKLSNEARKRAIDFNPSVFCKKIQDML